MSTCVAQDNINILKMVYDDVTVIDCDKIVTRTKDKIVLMDTSGNQLAEYDTQSHILCGSFVALWDSTSCTMVITSLKTGKQMTFKKKELVFRDLETIIPLGNEFMCINNIVQKTIINSNCETVVKIMFASDLKVYSEDESECILHYKSVHDGTEREAVLSKHTGKYITLDKCKLSDRYTLVGTGIAKYAGAIRPDNKTFSSIRYTLYKDNKPVGTEYADIRLIDNTEDSGLALVYEGIGGKTYTGIMNAETGEEIIGPSYKSIELIGKNILMLNEEIGVHHIYDINKGYIFTNLTSQNIKWHMVLPIIIIFADNKYSIVDKSGEVYDFVDFSKHWDCEYCKEDTSMIRVTFTDECGVRQKYMDTQLTEITNKSLIAEMSTKEWVKLS